jgi:hypothetical protein
LRSPISIINFQGNQPLISIAASVDWTIKQSSVLKNHPDKNSSFYTSGHRGQRTDMG